MSEPAAVAGPLAGVRVLELCHFLAGPYAGLVLADLGADVVKIEDHEHPDEARSMGPYFVGDQSLYFVALNSGKRSVGVRLAAPEGRDIVLDLVRGADVVIDNFRPGVLARLGLDHDVLRAVNERIVTCSLTGFGATGPDAALAGYDYTIQARAGVMSMAGEPDGPPTKAGISYVDHSGGLAGALAVCAALVERGRTGRGRHVDLGLFDVQVSMLTYLAAWQRNAGATITRTANSSHPSLVPAQNFRTADGYLVIFVGNDPMWARLVTALGRPELGDPRFAGRGGRLEHRVELLDLMQRILATRTSRAWTEVFDAAGVACSPVNTLQEALEERQVAARDLLVASEHPAYGRYEHVRGPVPGLAAADLAPSPLLGEHSREILGALGLSDERIDQLVALGVVAVGQGSR